MVNSLERSWEEYCQFIERTGPHKNWSDFINISHSLALENCFYETYSADELLVRALSELGALSYFVINNEQESVTGAIKAIAFNIVIYSILTNTNLEKPQITFGLGSTFEYLGEIATLLGNQLAKGLDQHDYNAQIILNILNGIYQNTLNTQDNFY